MVPVCTQSFSFFPVHSSTFPFSSIFLPLSSWLAMLLSFVVLPSRMYYITPFSLTVSCIFSGFMPFRILSELLLRRLSYMILFTFISLPPCRISIILDQTTSPFCTATPRTWTVKNSFQTTHIHRREGLACHPRVRFVGLDHTYIINMYNFLLTMPGLKFVDH